MSVPSKVASYKKYLTSLGYTVTGTYTPPSKKSKKKNSSKKSKPRKKQPKETDSENGSDSDSEDESDKSESESDDSSSGKRKSLSPKEKAKRFVKDNKHNWRLLQQDCEGNFSKSDLIDFSKRIGMKSSGSPTKICGALKKELGKYK